MYYNCSPYAQENGERMDMQDTDMKDIKMIQTELLEIETAVTETKKTLDGINRLDTAK